LDILDPDSSLKSHPEIPKGPAESGTERNTRRIEVSHSKDYRFRMIIRDRDEFRYLLWIMLSVSIKGNYMSLVMIHGILGSSKNGLAFAPVLLMP